MTKLNIPTDINPRWWIWQKVTGQTGGHNFICWMDEQWAAFYKVSGYGHYNKDATTQDKFDTWLRNEHREILSKFEVIDA